MDQPVAELRTDWLTGRSVLVAENRALRPNEFALEPASAGEEPKSTTSLLSCPFCAGNESRTPPPVYEKLDQHGRWQIRVVPNMYPATILPIVATDVASIASTAAEMHTVASPAIGAHEVIIESASHSDRLSALSKAELRGVLEAYSERLRHWRQDGRFRYGLVFKNQGPRAGASMAHLHSQLIALPFIPSAVEAEGARASEVHSQQRLCPYCNLVRQERSLASRTVIDQAGFLAFCPFASWQPHEVWLMPIDHSPWFEMATPGELDRLTWVLHALIKRLESVIADAAYNMIFRTAAWGIGSDEWSHWRIELLPRTNAFAGLELATGIHINPLSPERAARQLHLG